MAIAALDDQIGGVDPEKDNEPMTWTDIRFAYINCTLTPTQFAEKHGIEQATFNRRLHHGKWAGERKIVQAEIDRKAQLLVIEQRAKELAEFNKADLTMAKSIRGLVASKVHIMKRRKEEAELLNEDFEINHNELRTLAITVESTQRIGRLALGASTDSHELTGKGGSPLAAPTIIIGGPPEEGEPVPTDLDGLGAAAEEEIGGE